MAGASGVEADVAFWHGRPVLVTGCTGFLGSWLTAALVRAGASVVGVVRDIVPQSPFFRTRLSGSVSVVRGGVEEYGLLERSLNEYEIDTVLHLAAQSIVGVANRNPLGTFETNVRGTWNVLEACRRSPRVTRIVVASSDKAYGIHERLPYTEDLALRGSHPYDVSKSCADLIASAYHTTFRTPVCVSRTGNLFGGGDLNMSRIVPGTIRSVFYGQRPVIRSDGSPIRDYVHVEDAVEAYLLLARRMDDASIHGQAFNFGSGAPLSVLDLTRRILALMGREDLQPQILDEARAEIHHQYLSADRARSILGWAPSAPLDQRLQQTIGWYRDHLSALDSERG